MRSRKTFLAPSHRLARANDARASSRAPRATPREHDRRLRRTTQGGDRRARPTVRPGRFYRLDCIHIPLETHTIRVQRPTRAPTRPPRPHPRPPGCRPSIEASLGASRSFVGARVVVRVRAIRARRPAFARASFVGRFVAMMRAARGGGGGGGGGRAPSLAGMVDARVHVITNDGRHVVGTLRGFDQVTNVILEGCSERVYSSERGVEEAPLGLYMIRGDNMCVLSTDSNAWGGGFARRSTRRRGG